MNDLRLRKAAFADAPATEALLLEAFGGPAEAKLVEQLRRAGDLVLEMVAVDETGIVGHVAYSPLASSWGKGIVAVALAPLAVRPGKQRRGIGANLVRASLDQLRATGIDLVLVLGEPAYYGRFGFVPAADFSLTTPYDGPHQQALALSERGRAAQGLRLAYAGAFAAVG